MLSTPAPAHRAASWLKAAKVRWLHADSAEQKDFLRLVHTSLVKNPSCWRAEVNATVVDKQAAGTCRG